MIPIITIEGPTASGKSDLALKLAKQYDTEIISADSRQVYKYLDIGTAKPDAQTLSEVKHHLIDLITPDQKYSAGTFVKDAEKIINRLYQQNKIPIICGGTMLYIKCLLDGISDIPEVPDEILKQTEKYMQAHTLQQCYEFINTFDPKFAKLIAPTDTQRIIRAISVWFAFQKPISYYWEKQKYKPKYKPHRIYIDIERETLYERINKRMTLMIEQGLIDEIIKVLEMGYTAKDYGLTGVGYAEFIDIIMSKQLDNPLKLKECIDLAAQHTRNYAKRQLTWYRKSVASGQVSIISSSSIYV